MRDLSNGLLLVLWGICSLIDGTSAQEADEYTSREPLFKQDHLQPEGRKILLDRDSFPRKPEKLIGRPIWQRTADGTVTISFELIDSAGRTPSICPKNEIVNFGFRARWRSTPTGPPPIARHPAM